MGTIGKIAGWTIGAALVAKLATSANTGDIIKNVGSAWSGILGSITGAKTQ